MVKTNNHIRHLVFSGGGVKVISYAGALKVLEEKHIMKNIKKVAGTSGGAISALCVSLGYTAEEIKDILLKLDFNRFKDHKWIWETVWDLFKYHGLNSGDYYDSFLTQLITDKSFDKDITFKQLHDSSVTDIDLYVVCTNLNRQFPEVLSYETAPDRSVLQAVRASGAVPIYFYPIKHNNEVIVDGGVIYNYPIEIFDNNRQESMQRYFFPLPENNNTKSFENNNTKSIGTLGFTTIDKSILDAYQMGKEPDPSMKINDVLDIAVATITAFYNADSYRSFVNNDRTVFIDDMGISVLNFDITTDQKKDLINSGYNATSHFLSQDSEI